MSDTVNVIARLPRPLHERLRKAAFDQRTSINQIVKDAVTTWLDEHSEPLASHS